MEAKIECVLRGDKLDSESKFPLPENLVKIKDFAIYNFTIFIYTFKEISALSLQSNADSLLVNDREEVYNGAEDAVEPTESIEELVRQGKSAIPAVIPLIERYAREKEARYYIEYVADILGRIGGEEAVQLILKLLLSPNEDEDRDRMCINSLRRIGKAAVPAIASFVEENYDTESSEFAVWNLTEACGEISDPAIGSLLVKLLKHSHPGILRAALVSLRNQECDSSLLASIVPMLQYENKDTGEQQEVREGALIALEGMLRENLPELKRILTEHSLLSPDSIASLSKEVATKLEGFAWAEKRELFRGDEAQRLNDILREQVAKKSLAEVLEKVTRLMYHEAIIPYSEFQKIVERCESLERESYAIMWKSPWAFWITNWDRASSTNMHVVKKDEHRIRTSYLQGERWKQLVDVLHSQGFAVSHYFSDLLASSGDKTVLLTSRTAPGKKVWNDVTIRLCGEWREEEIMEWPRHFRYVFSL